MIGGNIKADIQLMTGVELSIIGEQVPVWKTVQSITGFLDLSGGDSKYTIYDAKVQESTHIFIADYVKLDTRIKAENSRMIVDSKQYDVMLIDDPMGLHKQFEIYLKYTGGV